MSAARLLFDGRTEFRLANIVKPITRRECQIGLLIPATKGLTLTPSLRFQIPTLSSSALYRREAATAAQTWPRPSSSAQPVQGDDEGCICTPHEALQSTAHPRDGTVLLLPCFFKGNLQQIEQRLHHTKDRNNKFPKGRRILGVSGAESTQPRSRPPPLSKHRMQCRCPENSLSTKNCSVCAHLLH